MVSASIVRSSSVVRRLGPATASPPPPPSPEAPWHCRHPALSQAASPAANRSASCANAEADSVRKAVVRQTDFDRVIRRNSSLAFLQLQYGLAERCGGLFFVIAAAAFDI